MTHQLEELRAHIRSSFLSYRPEADAALSEYEDGVVTLEEWHAALEKITDRRTDQIIQLIAQHDAALLEEILGKLPILKLDNVVQVLPSITPEEHKKMVWVLQWYEKETRALLEQYQPKTSIKNKTKPANPGIYDPFGIAGREK